MIFTDVSHFPLESLYRQGHGIAKLICCVRLFGVFDLKNKSVKNTCFATPVPGSVSSVPCVTFKAKNSRLLQVVLQNQ